MGKERAKVAWRVVLSISFSVAFIFFCPRHYPFLARRSPLTTSLSTFTGSSVCTKEKEIQMDMIWFYRDKKKKRQK